MLTTLFRLRKPAMQRSPRCFSAPAQTGALMILPSQQILCAGRRFMRRRAWLWFLLLAKFTWKRCGLATWKPLCRLVRQSALQVAVLVLDDTMAYLHRANAH